MSELLTGIYAIKNLVNNKVYIGQAIDINKRWREHLSSLLNNKHYNKHLQKSWNKYGKKNFTFEIIEECEEDKLNEKETEYIQYFKANNINLGYNQNIGGERPTGYNHTDAAKEKIRQCKLGSTTSDRHKKIVRDMMNKRWATDEYKEKMKSIGKSCPHPSGRKHTLEEIEKIRLAGLGRVFTEETKRKIGEANKSGKTAHPGNDYVKGRIWINNGVITKMIYPNELDKYLQNDFKLGRLKKEVIKFE